MSPATSSAQTTTPKITQATVLLPRRGAGAAWGMGTGGQGGC
ncbi:MAG: hypothetical protein WBB05_21675 [Mycolicibacterium fortuitum]|nr:hypothetical protein [Mycolicibacterium fortuitum]